MLPVFDYPMVISVRNLRRLGPYLEVAEIELPTNIKRLSGANFNYTVPLDHFVTSRTTAFFDLITVKPPYYEKGTVRKKKSI
jgi:hypothetical protein